MNHRSPSEKKLTRRAFLRDCTAASAAVVALPSFPARAAGAAPPLDAALDASLAARISDQAIARRREMIIRAIAKDPSFSPTRKSPKYQHAIVAARLALNPGDPAMLEYIRRVADVDDDFAYHGLATVFAQFGDDWPPEVVEAIRKSVTGWKGFLRGGTENMVAMCRCAGLLFGERFPEEKFQYGLTGRDLAAECTKFMRTYGRAIFGGSMVEYLSPIYVATNSQAWINVADRARDEEARFLAGAILDWMMVDLALNSFEGAAVAPLTREKGLLTGTYQRSYAVSNTQWVSWMFFGGGNTKDDGGDFPAGHEPYKPPPGFHAVSRWLPHPVIRHLAAGRLAMPYSVAQARAGWAYIEPTMVNGFGKKEATGRSAPGLEDPRYQLRSAYMARDYALGAGYFKTDPEQPLNSSAVPFAIWWKSQHEHNFLHVVHPFWHVGLSLEEGGKPLGDDDRLGLSPFCRMVHHENAAILLYDLPDEDPYLETERRGSKKFEAERPAKLIHAIYAHVPETVDERIQSPAGFFLREGDVYIALRPLAPGARWTTSRHEGFVRIEIPGAVTGLALEVGDRAEYGSFAEFQKRVSEAALDLSQLASAKTAAYVSSRGHRLRVRSVPGTWLPDASVNDQKLDFENWPITKSPYVYCAGNVLEVNDGRAGFSIDWRQDLPIYTYFSLAQDKPTPTRKRYLHGGKIFEQPI